MKELDHIPDHYSFKEAFYIGSPQQVSIFRRKVLNQKIISKNSRQGELAQLEADNCHDSNFERAFMFFDDRCPTWPEMVALKEFFWEPNDIVFQVHPRKEDYVNINKTALHLWRPKDRKSFKELRNIPLLVHNTLVMLQREDTSSDLHFREGCIHKKKFVAIFGGNEWPTWECVCSIKKHCFGENRVALQFNICREMDLNPHHLLLLWDADNFPNIALPPKEHV